MFLCSKCGSNFSLPECQCGHSICNIDSIWQFTDDPDIVTRGDGDHYIGYEEIGEHFSGNQKYVIDGGNTMVADEIAKLTDAGVFLDLGCGDGHFTVPVAKNGIKVIAADISNNMMRILQRKAAHNNISLMPHVVLCRMNALRPLIADNSIHSAICNSVLHLISRPDKVIGEIHRVLDRHGCFIFKDDMPGSSSNEMSDDSKDYVKVCNSIYKIYWDILKEHDLYPKKYNWKYDREGICNPIFASRDEVIIPWGVERVETLKDGFLARFSGKGFSDQVDIPKNLHSEALVKTLEIAQREYGSDFGKMEVRWTEPDIKLTIYRK